MGFWGGFAKSINSNQDMMLKKIMMNGQGGVGSPQEPNNPYPAGGSTVSYDPRQMEDAMDMALGKEPQFQGGGGEDIQSSGMTAQAGTQLPPQNILAGLRAAMMGRMGQGGGF